MTTTHNQDPPYHKIEKTYETWYDACAVWDKTPNSAILHKVIDRDSHGNEAKIWAVVPEEIAMAIFDGKPVEIEPEGFTNRG